MVVLPVLRFPRTGINSVVWTIRSDYSTGIGRIFASRRFRAMLDQGLGVVRAIRPECPAQISGDGQSMTISHGTPVLPAPQTATRH